MKKNIIKLITFFSITAFLVSCSNREEDLFKEPASTRLEKNRSQYQNILESSEQGWILQYFPHPEQKFGGINYYVNFKDGNVTATIDGTENEISSTYSVINRGGNLLSFNSYNPILHAFANPSGREPKGSEGDFEFLILNHKDNVVNLKGVRSGNLMKLIKLDKNYKEYKNKVNEINSRLSAASLGGKMEDSNIEISLDNFTLDFRYKEGDEIKSEKVAFITTDKGISLYEPITIKGVTIQEFLFNKEKDSFSNLDGKLVIRIIVPPIDLANEAWELNVEDGVAKSFRDLWLVAAKEDYKTYQWLLYNIINIGKVNIGFVGVEFFTISDIDKGSGYPAVHTLEFSGSLDNENYLEIKKSVPARNWQFFPFFTPMVDALAQNSPYNVEKDSANQVKLTSVNNPDFWFILKK